MKSGKTISLPDSAITSCLVLFALTYLGAGISFWVQLIAKKLEFPCISCYVFAQTIFDVIKLQAETYPEQFSHGD